MQFSVDGILYTVIDEANRLVSTGNNLNSGPNAVSSNFGPNLKIPEKVKGEDGRYFCVAEVGSYSFSQCTCILEVFVPSSVEIIRKCGFWFLTKCTSFTFGANSRLREIEDTGMRDMNLLKSLVFTGSCLKRLGPSCFSYIYNLETLVIPSSVIYIGSNALCGISEIKSIRYCGSSQFGTDILTSHSTTNTKTNATVKIYTNSDYKYSYFGNRNDIIKSDDSVCKLKHSLCLNKVQTCRKQATKSSLFVYIFILMALS